MSDIIFLAKDQKEQCDGCPKPAICIDGSGEFLCEYCAYERHGALE